MLITHWINIWNDALPLDAIEVEEILPEDPTEANRREPHIIAH